MSDAARDLPLQFAGHHAHVLVQTDEDGGWLVSTEVDGRQIATDYCPDWRAVERFHSRMQQWLKTAATQSRYSAA
jgi:hypothetical protein